MGVGYYKSLTQWSKGEYTGANQKQDDLAIIRNFLPAVPTDAGATVTAATQLQGELLSSTNMTAKVQGTVVDATIVNWYKFSAGAGLMTVAVKVTPSSGSYLRSNLDIALILYGTDGSTVLWTADPSTCGSSGSLCLDGATDGTLGASLSYNLPAAGVYYLAIQATGANDPATVGYSAYGSLGNYYLTTVFPGNPVPPPPPTPAAPMAPATSRVVTASVTNLIPTRSGTNPKNYKRWATATVHVADATSNSAIAGATITGRWEFSTTQGGFSPYAVTLVTNSAGTVSSTSKITSAAGTFTFTVTGVTGPGLIFNGVQAKQSAYRD